MSPPSRPGSTPGPPSNGTPLPPPVAVAGACGAPLPPDLTVWQLSLAPEPAELDALRRALSPEERARADRFLFDRHRRRWTACRAQVRRILSETVGADPSALVFEEGEHGKPFLRQPAPHFNVSHSGELALLAISPRVELGVDLERINAKRRTDQIADRYFSAAEVAGYRAIDDDEERLRTFFRLWSCKEAYIKAIGLGLAAGLDTFDIDLAPNRPATLAASRRDPADAHRWSLHELEGPPGFAAAVMIATE